jgi:protein ImuB
MTKRILSVFLPNWSADLFHRHNSKKNGHTFNRELLFAVTIAGERLVARCCALSRKSGVTVGMKLANAIARTKDSLIVPFEPEREQNAMYRLAQWAYKFSPLVAPDIVLETGPITDLRFDGINIDITGCARLFNGEHRLIESLCAGLADLGLSFRVAVAPTLGSAWAFSRYCPTQFTVIDDKELFTTLSELPVSALRIPSRIKNALSDLNIHLIGELTKLPRRAILAHFDALLLDRLDYALGRKEELITPVRFKTTSRCRKTFEGPTTQLEAIVETSSNLLRELLNKLEARNQKLATLRFVITRVDAHALVKDITLCAASSHFDHIWALVRPKIEVFDMGAGVSEITLTALRSEDIFPVDTNQKTTPITANSHSKEFAELIDTLNEELGSDRLLTIECSESYFPEQAFSYESLLSKRSQLPATATMIDADRPSVLLSTPQQIQAMALLPDNPPFRIRWGRHNFNLKHGMGPERIAPAWWGRDEQLCKTRDYFKVQLHTGLWLWVYREIETARWFLHGVWA